MRELYDCSSNFIHSPRLGWSGVNNKRRVLEETPISSCTCVVIRCSIIIHTSDVAPSSESLRVYFGLAIAKSEAKTVKNEFIFTPITAANFSSRIERFAIIKF